MTPIKKLFVLLAAALLINFTPHQAFAKSESKILQSASINLCRQLLKDAVKKDEAVAVLPFENAQGKITQLGQVISEALSGEVIKNGAYQVVERSQVEKIYTEMKISLLGAINPSTAQQIGKLSGAGYLVMGSAHRIGMNEIQIFARLVRTESGEIRQVASCSVKADDALIVMNRPLHPAGDKEEQATVLPKKGEGGCAWVESPGIADFSELSTRKQVRAKAIVSARQKAMSAVMEYEPLPEFSGFDLTAFGRDPNLIDNTLLLTRYGRISDERIVEEGVVDGPNCKGCKYRALIQVCVAPQRKNSDKQFQVQLNLNRNQFIEGDEAQAIVNSTKDSYVYIFSVDADWNTSLVFPNNAARENQIHLNESLDYPSEAHKKAGIHLVAELPKDAEVSAETLRVIAVPRPLKESDLKGNYMQIVERLNAGGTDWVEDAQSFTILKGVKK